MAAAASALAVAITANWPLLHDRPYLLPLAAVALSAWLGGFVPAMIATGLALGAVNVFLASTEPWGIGHVLTGAVFLGVAALIASSARAMARTAARARRQSAHFEAMFGQAAVGIAHTTLDGRFERVNQRMAALAGRPIEEMPRFTCEELTHPDDRPAIAAALAEVAAGRRAEFSADLRGLRPDGTAVWRHVSIAPLRGDDGRPESLIAIVKDIHERRAAEERARLSEERARLALDIARLGTWSWMAGARRVDADERTREVAGFPPTGPLTTGMVQARVHPDDWPRLQAAVQRALDAETVYAEEFRFVHEDGSVHWVVSRGQAVRPREGAGRAPVMLGSMLDITARHLAEDALKRADRQKDDFLALLSHELRNPLAPIRTAVHLLKLRLAPDADHQRLLGIIERQVQHLVRLVDDLLDVSRVLRGRIELRPEPLDVADVIATAVETTRPAIDARRQRLRIELPDSPMCVHGDQVRLSQVVANLLHNASKFTDRGGELALRVAREDGQVVLRVRDAGAGIAPDVLPTIFEPFVQADRSLERSQGGLGIGLTLVRKIIELHGGTVDAASEGLGRGSTFTARLPMLTHAAQPRGGEAAPPTPLRTGLRVLVVDDNVDAAGSLAELLRDRGQIVTVAHNGQEALALALQEQPDIVLLDIGLPGMNGYEVASALRRQSSGQPVLVAITGYGQDGDARRAAAAGFDRHLVKPVDASQLERVLASLVA